MSALRVVLAAGSPLNQADPDECPVCRREALLTFPLVALLPTGVAQAGYTSRCLHCHSAANRSQPPQRYEPPV